jgi:hypothetical protein
VTAAVAVLPAVLVLFFAVVQISLWFYARSVATTAARHGLDAARIETGTQGDGEATASQFLGQVGGLRDATVAVDRGAEEATITVTGHAVELLPFFEAPITVTLDAPVERFVE